MPIITRSKTASRAKVQNEPDSSSTASEDKQSDANGESTEKKMLPKTISEGLKEEDERHLKTSTAIFLILVIFATSVSALAYVYYSFPHLEK